MYDLRLIRLLVLPSLFSGILTLLLSTVVLGYDVWLYIGEERLFYDYLFGYSGLETYLLQHSQFLSVWQKFFFNSPVVYYALVAMLAAITGLITYFLLQLIGLVSHSVKEGWDSLRSKGKTARSVAYELLARLGLRIISIVCWGLYAGFFSSLAFPFALALSRIGIDYINESMPIGWFVCAGALLFLMVLVHMHVIFLRLVFLRPRIFGGRLALTLALTQAEASNHDPL